jgi:hypothetical protein
VITSSGVPGRGWGKGSSSITAINLAIEWNWRAGKLNWNLYDPNAIPPDELPEGMKWEYPHDRWTVVEG